MQSNQDVLEGIQTSLFTVSAMKPLTVAPSATSSFTKKNTYTKSAVQPRVQNRTVMNMQNSNFSASNRRIEMNLNATSGKVEMRSNSTDHKIEKLAAMPSKPAKPS